MISLPETKYALSGDVHIAYQVTGDGPVDLIMAPGTMSHLDLDWEVPGRVNFIHGLAKFCRVIRFDKRGTGLSDRPLRMATLEERADDIRAVMDSVAIDSAHLFGASEGGSMSCMFAATYPERTLSLTVYGAMARWVQTPDHPWGNTPEEQEFMLESIRAGWPSEFYITGPGAGLGKNASPEQVEAVARYMRAAANPAAVLAYEQMNGEIDTRPILPAIRCPALVLVRSGDPVADAAGARDMASRIPGAKFIEYPGSSHRLGPDILDAFLADIEEFVTGARPPQAVDRILATVLFLDLVGSTAKAASLGDAAWKNVLEGFYLVVRRELLRYRGLERSTSGDGFFATFDGPGRAVHCALAIAQSVRDLGLEIRAGVHVGECELMGDDVGGLAVHVGARVMGLAAPGTVLASSTVKDLTSGSGLQFTDAGSHELKGVPGCWTLYRAGA
jgi:class 3 adenylate cyclase